MKQEIIFLSVFLVLMVSLASAAIDADPIGINSEVDQAKAEIIGKQLPKPLGTLFGNERVNVHIKLNNDEIVTLGVVTQNKKFVKFELGELENPSLNVYITENALREVQRSSNPAKALQRALGQGKAKYKAVGFFNKIKFKIISLFINVMAGAEEEVPPAEEPEIEFEEELVGEQEEELEEETELESEGGEAEAGEEEQEGTETEETDEGSELTGANVVTSGSHIVTITNDGFSPEKITIKSGDTIEWVNERSGSLSSAMVIGTRLCREVKSKVFKSGETFTWTFDGEYPEDCTIVDGIYTTQESKVVVIE